jgi:type I restriction enzyme S subunit
MNGKQLKNSILQWAIKGKLVPKDPNDEPASVLLEKIRQEKERLIKEKKIKRDKNASVIYRGEDNSYYEKMLATGEVKCIDKEIPFEIPEGWEWCRLGEISTYAQTKRKINASNADTQLWGLDLEDIEKGGRLLNIKTVGERKAIGDKTVFNRGDILYSKLRPYLLKILVAPEGGICTPEIIPFTCYGNICKDYIVSFLKSPYVDDYINSATFGVKMPRVSTETMTSLLVPLPPLSEQFRIDTRIKELMPYIDEYGKAQDKLNKLNEELSNTIRKSILQEAIQGKLVPQIAEEGTAQELLEQIKAEKQKLVKEGKLKKSALNDSVIFKGDDNKYYELIDNSPVCIDEFLPFQIPETWTWCKVKDLVEIQTGASFKKEQANANKKGIRILRGGNILPNKYIFKDDDVFVSEEFVNANTILKKNCIITPAVTSLENIGKMAVIEKDYNNVSAGGFVFIIRPYIQDFNHSLLLAYFLQSPFLIEAMRGITKKSGAAFYNLGKERLKELYLPLPPMAEQRRIVGKINEVLSSIMSR